MHVLALESSCDETAAAVVACSSAPGHWPPRLEVLSNVLHSQVSTHARFGGVVPEVASREHLARLHGLVQAAVAPIGGLQHIDGIAVTRGPGLVGALLVGLQLAKGLALALERPWVGVHHLEGHLSAALLVPEPPPLPHAALLVSGGHTQLLAVHGFGRYRLLGSTRDDAAGEAFDKVAKILGLGYPGGVAIERAARGGAPDAVPLPRALPGASLDFSFSGLKTAALRYVQQHGGQLSGQHLADFCAAVQDAICAPLVRKAVLGARQNQLPCIVLAGGVAANGRLRQLLAEAATAQGLSCFAPPRPLCTDNAAMVGAAGIVRLAGGEQTPLPISARSRWPLEELGPPQAQQARSA